MNINTSDNLITKHKKHENGKLKMLIYQINHKRM